jgi:chain length determinant protein EpsF
MTFEQFVLILRARWTLAVGILGIVVALALTASFLATKQYTAEASVVVDSKVDPVAGMVYSEERLSSYIATQVDIITSERVAQRVVKMLKLDDVPAFRQQWLSSTSGRGDLTVWLGHVLQRSLNVTPSRESNVINISVKWPNAKAAAALANAFAQAYIDTNIELKVDPAKQYATWFDERSKALRTDLEAKQKRLSDYQNQTGIIATDERLDVENARLNELSSQLVAIQAQLQDSQSRQRQANGDNESLPEVLQSSLIASLKADLSRAESQQQDIATRLGKNHPDYQTAAADVASLRAKIRQETDKIAASLGNTTQINQRREGDVRAALEAQKKRMLELKHQHDEAADLQNDVLTAQRNLDAVTQRLAQSSLESQTQQTNIVLLTPAAEPIEPSSPRLLLNLLLAIFFGTVVGIGSAIGMELMYQRVRADREMEQLLGVPLLGRVAYVDFVTMERKALPVVATKPGLAPI